MDLVGVLRAVFALMTVLGLILGLAFILRRYAPQLMARLTAPRGQKRMQVVETLVLDPARRLVLVRLDDEERLLLLGEGKELIEPRQLPKPKPKLPPEPTPAARPALRTRPLSDKDL
ncbi:flagellar biosynthetic protein FliO [Asticcacaulis sp. ZE23SCel15]|uniref:flagellar biosynthetic protein FliO n=1 Tax=Asticcacaulis sp. ZE23SCel15 TaxID=3059027 RepID=UPI00265E4025|nr:flagellar biosynthetic protein FliO [Asticcacaulis sp. ZE23SCel15]WKL57543.1 flagellar biosynthetic protein FliO [Asticcacaulis sp. ZE23SCel15]